MFTPFDPLTIYIMVNTSRESALANRNRVRISLLGQDKGRLGTVPVVCGTCIPPLSNR